MNNIPLVICTCNKYIDIWPLFLKQWKKYWPNYNGKIYINTDGSLPKKPLIGSAEVIENIGFENNWSARLFNTLKGLTSKYIILSLEDFLLKSSVDEESLIGVFNTIKQDKKFASLCFQPQPGKLKKINDNGFGYQGFSGRYRVNAQIAIWDRLKLMKILRNKENPWQFEIYGSIRSSVKYHWHFYAPERKEDKKYIFDYHISLIQGGRYFEEYKTYYEKVEGLSFPVLPEPSSDPKRLSFGKKISMVFNGFFSTFKKEIH